jgi:hypothetical protein
MVHLNTNAAVQTVLVKTVSNLTPTEVFALVDLLGRTRFTASDENYPSNLANESNLGTLFPSGAQTW